MMKSSQMDPLTTPVAISSSPAKVKNKSSLLAYRCMIVYRFALALLGGYVLAALSAIVIAQYFMEYGTSAAMSATLLAFTIHTAAFIWIFMVNKTLNASLGIILPGILLFVIYKFLGN
ncbi:hypothetical protein [Acinetobacter sp. TSRC1-2]|uniref:hypothetical protein n=1 Tax=unclassified Acinetobacter TaxID=196816 RepID=UPI003CF552FF